MWFLYMLVLFGFLLLMAALVAYGVSVAAPKPPLFYPRQPEPVETPSVSFSFDSDYYPIPRRAHPADAGLDLSAVESKLVNPGGVVTINTGVRMAIPQGYVGFLCLRSSFAYNNPDLRLLNNVGVIDSGYTGNISAIFRNEGSEPCQIYKGTRFAQLVVVPCLLGNPQFAQSLERTERGDGGFGSTGK